MSKKKRPTPVPPEPLPELFDAHTHLASCHTTTPDEVVTIMDRAAAVGVNQVCTVGDDLAESVQALEAAHADERVFAACAIHPTRADQLFEDGVQDSLRELAADPRCVAVGETGLDTYWITHDPEQTAPLDVQESALRWHMALAHELDKPLMIHNREADADLLRVLDDAPDDLRIMLHCFSSPLAVAQEAVDRGYWLSFCGNVTFKRNDELREAARICPSERILVETDAPFMTPEPFRGARNEPAFVGYTARCVAEVRGVTPEALGAQVTRNARDLYRITE
ncbi:TatD family hydrolase [Corynebacterium variabile]|uniref:TatD family hydrolase n=1 Tax=Corynebacterium variabile TaxID=1727 RepID=UPI003735B215